VGKGYVEWIYHDPRCFALLRKEVEHVQKTVSVSLLPTIVLPILTLTIPISHMRSSRLLTSPLSKSVNPLLTF
jgi:hypothetical protein